MPNPKWLHPGMLFRDPETGCFVRTNKDLELCPDSAEDASRLAWWKTKLVLTAQSQPAIDRFLFTAQSHLRDRALAAGPWVQDVATCGAMAMSFPQGFQPLTDVGPAWVSWVADSWSAYWRHPCQNT